MKKKILLVILSLGLIYVLNFNFLVNAVLFNKGQSGHPPVIGPVLTNLSVQEQIPNTCMMIDYVHYGPSYIGLPFVAIEQLHDECAAFYHNPNHYQKVYPLGFVLNVLATLGLVFIPATLLTNRKNNKRKD